ncbi:MAG: hypothetical protein M5U19_17730 [Microthrixaceae bacterium]|nr:hypothetical protein [Microthrixaceae bacterium]
MFDQWDDLFLSGAFAPRAVLLRGLSLDEASTVPDGTPHSIYQELWHATKVLEMSLANGRVVLESWPLEEHFQASPAPSNESAWRALGYRPSSRRPREPSPSRGTRGGLPRRIPGTSASV